MFKSFTAILTLVAVTLLTTIGSLWLLGLIAFGSAKCTGINTWAAIALAIIGAGVIVMIEKFFDMGSDWVAARAATRSSDTQMKEMMDLIKLQTGQARAAAAQQSMLNKIPEHGPTGGLMGDDFDPGPSKI